MNQEDLKVKLTEANKKYRAGEDSGLTDEQYDDLLSQVEDDAFKGAIGVEIEIDKVELPVPMGSMEKIKTNKEVEKWFTNIDDVVVSTPKYDGLALLLEYGMDGRFVRAMTRGNGTVGQDVTGHFRNHKLASINSGFKETTYIVGEAIMDKNTFLTKYSKDFKNGRNMVAGMLARKVTSIHIKDVSVMAFNVINTATDNMSKTQILDICNSHFNNPVNKTHVPFKVYNNLDTQAIEDIHNDRITYDKFEIDGYIIEACSKDIRTDLGTETNSLNPKFARAYKPAVEESIITTVLDIEWSTSKSGKLAPVVKLDPVELDGVTISNVTAYNAKFVADNNLRVGSSVKIIRSGSVIPKIIEVYSISNGRTDLPEQCPSCRSAVHFNETKVDLMCYNESCSAKSLKSVISFFTLLEIEYCKEGTIKTLFENGFNSVAKICTMSVDDFEPISGFGKPRAEKIINAIKEKLESGILLEDIQHASNLFNNLGSRKLKLLNEYRSSENKPSVDDIVKLEGFSEISAESYLEGFDQFWEFIKDIPVNIIEEEVKESGDDTLSDKVCVFTGVRDKEFQELLESKGATISSSVTKKTTTLIVKDVNSTSSKVKKARDMGIEIVEHLAFKESIING